MLLQYNLVGTPTKSTMLRYFQESLKSSILAELKYQDLELESFNKMVKKAVDTKVKLAIRPHSSTNFSTRSELSLGQLTSQLHHCQESDNTMKDL